MLEIHFLILSIYFLILKNCFGISENECIILHVRVKGF